MKSTLLIAAAILLAGPALAQDGFPYGGIMGVYFSETVFDDSTTNFDTFGAPFYLYLALTDLQVTAIAGYECGFTFSEPDVHLLNVVIDPPQEWFTGYANHLVGFGTPKIVPESGELLLCAISTLYVHTRYVAITLGPSAPSSGDPDGNPDGWSWNGPLIADGSAEQLFRCDLSSGASGEPDVVATLNAPATPVESASWSGIRSLFD